MYKPLKNILQTEIDPAFAKRAEYIFRALEKEKPSRVLDAGCGRGFYLHALSLYSFPKEIHGIDVEEKYLRKIKSRKLDKRIVVKKASLYKLPYLDGSFDFIICSEVLEHLKNDGKALKELKRVLRKGGTLIITVPNCNFPFLWDPLNWILMRLFHAHIPKNIWWLAGIWADHERLYEKSEIKNLISNAGFKIEEEKLFIRWCWPFSHFLLYGVGKNLVEMFGAKEFDRFNFKEKPLAKFLANFFRLPSLLDSKNHKTTSVIILLSSTK